MVENIVNLNEKGEISRYIDSETLAPGESIVLIIKGRKVALQVHTSGTSYYMISVTQARTEKIKEGLAVFIDGEEVDYTTTDDFLIETGGGVKIENREFSSESITVDWVF